MTFLTQLAEAWLWLLRVVELAVDVCMWVRNLQRLPYVQ